MPVHSVLRQSLKFGDISVHRSDRMDNLVKAHILSIRIDQAIFGVQGRLAFRRAFARTTSFRMIAVKATFAGFPVSMR